MFRTSSDNITLPIFTISRVFHALNDGAGAWRTLPGESLHKVTVDLAIALYDRDQRCDLVNQFVDCECRPCCEEQYASAQ